MSKTIIVTGANGNLGVDVVSTLHKSGYHIWKTLHMMVYLAYVFLIGHVMLGVIQLEKSTILIGIAGVGMFTILSLHLVAGRLERKQVIVPNEKDLEGFYPVCLVSEIIEKRAKSVLVKGENIAIFKYDGKLSAINNLCRHQNGPLGEGKIVDGCITCPWHGYQYLPHNGQSPPPFTEKVETYDVKVFNDWVYVNPSPYPEGTERPPCSLNNTLKRLSNIAK